MRQDALFVNKIYSLQASKEKWFKICYVMQEYWTNEQR